MKSSKRRRLELSAKRRAAHDQEAARETIERRERHIARGAPVDASALAPNNSYGAPQFVERGYYQDVQFRCVDCGKDEVWTATQQKWWYEVAKGFAYSTAKRCRACRRRDREARAESRRAHAQGLLRKALRRQDGT